MSVNNSTRPRKSNSRYEDEGFALVQFLDDGIFHVLSSTDVVVKDDEKVAKYEDNNFYKCTVLKLSDDKESLLKQKNSLSNSKKKEKKTTAAKKKKMPKENKGPAVTQTTKKAQKRKKNCSNNNDEKEDAENKDNERKRKEKREKDKKDKEKRQKIFTARVDNLVERMSLESDDDRFYSEVVDECCQILSPSNHSRMIEGEADPIIQHKDNRNASGTPMQVSSIASGYRKPPSPDRDDMPEAALAELIQHQDARKVAGIPSVSGRAQQSPVQSTLPSERPMQNQVRGQFTSKFRQPCNTPLRPTTGIKRPRQHPLQQPISDSEDDEDFECSNCKRLKQENEDLKRNLQDVLQNKVSEPPRPGKIHPLNARRFQMVELTPGSRVFVYPNYLEQASRKTSASGCAAYLLNSFYTNQELLGKNLTGANGKASINPDILNSIVGFTLKKYQGCSESGIKISLRNKLSALNSRKSIKS